MKKFGIVLITLVLFLFYRNWFISKQIIGGDWPYFYTDFIKGLPLLVPSWSSYQGNGLGGIPVVYPLDGYLYFISAIFVRGLNIPWIIIYKIFYFGTFITASAFSTYYFVRTIQIRVSTWRWILSVIIFSTNTYILMVVGGGQMGVALAYSFVPLALGSWISLIQSVISENNYNLKKSLSSGLFFTVIIFFDARIAFILAIAVLFYILFYLIFVYKSIHVYKLHIRSVSNSLIYIFGIPILISILLHATWVIPILLFKTTPLNNLVINFISSESLKYYSFATFSDSFALLHPNWPENIFGKIYFLRPEFLLLPMIAFSSLLTLYQYQKNQLILTVNMLFMSFLGIIGIFLAKGANEPFGFINIWLYENVPGFVLFRDPTKFYIFVILSYTVLIPIGIEYIVNLTKNRLPHIRHVFYVIFLVIWLALNRQAILGHLHGTFTEVEVPIEYKRFKDTLAQDKTFSRTLWIPRQHRFSYYSNIHPAIESIPLFQTVNAREVLNILDKENTYNFVRSLSVRYVVIPYDPNGEIFIKDRSYDNTLRQLFIDKLDTIPWLVRDHSFKNLAVYYLSDMYGRFYLLMDGNVIRSLIPFREIQANHYVIHVSINKPSILIFSEHYNPYWIATANGRKINSTQTSFGLNSFALSEKGTYNVDITFTQQNIYNYGTIVSLVTAFSIIGYYIFIYEK